MINLLTMLSCMLIQMPSHLGFIPEIQTALCGNFAFKFVIYANVLGHNCSGNTLTFPFAVPTFAFGVFCRRAPQLGKTIILEYFQALLASIKVAMDLLFIAILDHIWCHFLLPSCKQSSSKAASTP